jgi:hypothetical protein
MCDKFLNNTLLYILNILFPSLSLYFQLYYAVSLMTFMMRLCISMVFYSDYSVFSPVLAHHFHFSLRLQTEQTYFVLHRVDIF